LEPGYVRFLAEAVECALATLSDSVRPEAVVIFTAHSLPARILQSGDPYPDQLRATAAVVAERAGLERWTVGWQSAGRTPEPWLGPDITEVIQKLAADGVPGVVVCPCGFVADHLEVLYDVDIEAKNAASAANVELVRTEMPNDKPAFLDVLAAIVGRGFDAA
jgi:ferrochelatase